MPSDGNPNGKSLAPEDASTRKRTARSSSQTTADGTATEASINTSILIPRHVDEPGACVFGNGIGNNLRAMSERRSSGRTSSERRHPLREKAKLRTAGPALERRSEKRERLTVKLRTEIIDRLRNAVFYTPGLTINGFIEKCIVSIVGEMEKERGAEFPERTENLRAGRPRSQKS